MVDSARDVLLTMEEVAQRLRCSASKVRHLKDAGKLAYIPGRPVYILESDLNDYLERVRRAAKKEPEPGSPEAQAAAIAAARARARKKWLQRRMREAARGR